MNNRYMNLITVQIFGIGFSISIGNPVTAIRELINYIRERSE